MDIEKEELKLRLIEAQMTILQYQHRDVLAAIEASKKATTNPTIEA